MTPFEYGATASAGTAASNHPVVNRTAGSIFVARQTKAYRYLRVEHTAGAGSAAVFSIYDVTDVFPWANAANIPRPGDPIANTGPITLAANGVVDYDLTSVSLTAGRVYAVCFNTNNSGGTVTMYRVQTAGTPSVWSFRGNSDEVAPFPEAWESSVGGFSTANYGPAFLLHGSPA